MSFSHPLFFYCLLAAQIRTITINGNHHEANQRKNERYVHGRHAEASTHIDDACLHRRQYRTTEDSHNQAGSTKLCIVAHTLQGDTIDGREHQRHTCRYGYQAVHTHSVLEEDDTASEDTSSHRQDSQQHACIQVTQDEGTDEAATAENHHGYDVVCLRQDFGITFRHSFRHEDTGTVLDNEGPAHDLCTYIE